MGYLDLHILIGGRRDNFREALWILHTENHSQGIRTMYKEIYNLARFVLISLILSLAIIAIMSKKIKFRI